MKIKTINPSVAKIYFEDDQGNPIRIPSGIRLWDITNDVGVRRESTSQSFYISWVSDYEVRKDGITIYALRNQKQQSAQGTDEYDYSIEKHDSSSSEDETDSDLDESGSSGDNDTDGMDADDSA